MLGEQGYAVARRYLLRQKFTESGSNIPTYWDLETSKDLSRIFSQSRPHLLPSSASILTFQGKNLASQLWVEEIGERINTLNNQTNSFEDQKKCANAFPSRLVTIPRSMSVVVPPNCSKQMPQRREGVGLLYLWQRFSSHCSLLGGRHQWDN